ncbi:MAG TPA: DUF5662 family protein [Thermomicrobiales bacterium]|nr:DUF5662 family protein [Thermomicrobiales bacterium]
MQGNDGFIASTTSHIRRVHDLLREIQRELEDRGEAHDASKLREPEVSLFDQAYADLGAVEYGSEGYQNALVQARQALDHHYAHNRHHPEHFPGGVNDMTLVDLLEMLADWKAASERRPDAEIHEGIRINAERFNLSPQLANIFLNTAVAWWGGPEHAADHIADPGSVPVEPSAPTERDIFAAACERIWSAYQGSLEGRTIEEIAIEIGLEPVNVEHVVLAVSRLLERERHA